MATTTDPAAQVTADVHETASDQTAARTEGTRTDGASGGEAGTGDGARPAGSRSRFPWRTIALGTVGSVLLAASATGAAGILIRDPILGHGPLSWLRYGHGRAIATFTLYVGFALIVWAWVRLGRHVLAKRIGAKPVLAAAGCWMAPLVFSPPVFTRDVFSYIAQGTQALYGINPYSVGPVVLENLPVVVQNVHPFWQTTPAPYGPLFILFAKGMASIIGNNLIFGVIAMRLLMMTGLGLVIWALPKLCRYMGGSLPVAYWLAIASPLTVVHLVGGPHNEMMMIGPLVLGVLMMLERKHVLGIVLVTIAMAIKATAALALPFLVWIWARHLPYRSAFARFLGAGTYATSIFAALFSAITLVTFGWYNLGWLEGLSAPTMIVNWQNIPTGIGELLHSLVGWIFTDNRMVLVNVFRTVGTVVLGVFIARQWWLSRHGGTVAVRRLTMVLIAAAVLAPPTLPWYLTWGCTLAAAMAWRQRYLAIWVGVSVFLVLTYTPAGEDQMYNWPLMIGVFAAGLLAGRSLLHPDPLRLFRDKKQAERQDPPASDEPRVVEMRAGERAGAAGRRGVPERQDGQQNGHPESNGRSSGDGQAGQGEPDTEPVATEPPSQSTS